MYPFWEIYVHVKKRRRKKGILDKKYMEMRIYIFVFG